MLYFIVILCMPMLYAAEQSLFFEQMFKQLRAIAQQPPKQRPAKGHLQDLEIQFARARMHAITNKTPEKVFMPMYRAPHRYDTPMSERDLSNLSTVLEKRFATGKDVISPLLVDFYHQIKSSSALPLKAKWDLYVDLVSYCAPVYPGKVALLRHKDQIFLIYEGSPEKPLFIAFLLKMQGLSAHTQIQKYIEEMLSRSPDRPKLNLGGSFLERQVNAPTKHYETVKPTLEIDGFALFDQQAIQESSKLQKVIQTIQDARMNARDTHVYTDPRVVYGILFMLEHERTKIKTKFPDHMHLMPTSKDPQLKFLEKTQGLTFLDPPSDLDTYTLENFLSQLYPYRRIRL